MIDKPQDLIPDAQIQRRPPVKRTWQSAAVAMIGFPKWTWTKMVFVYTAAIPWPHAHGVRRFSAMMSYARTAHLLKRTGRRAMAV